MENGRPPCDTLIAQTPLESHHSESTMPAVNYKNPPISEVSFGLAFTPLDGFRTSHYGLFWNQIRSDYPETVDQPPILTQLPSISIQENKFSFPLPRCWYIHRDRKLLIQLQSDRIWLNWRHLTSADDYPHFPSITRPLQATCCFAWRISNGS